MTRLQDALFNGSEAPFAYMLDLGHIAIRIV